MALWLNDFCSLVPLLFCSFDLSHLRPVLHRFFRRENNRRPLFICREQHTAGIFIEKLLRRKIGQNHDLFSRQLICRIEILDTGKDDACTQFSAVDFQPVQFFASFRNRDVFYRPDANIQFLKFFKCYGVHLFVMLNLFQHLSINEL